MATSRPLLSESDVGLILKVLPFRDSDIIATTFLRGHGRMSLLARGARSSKKRFPQSLDLFDLGDFEFSRGKGSMASLVRFTPARRFPRFRESLGRLSLASTLLQATFLLVTEESQGEAQSFDVVSTGLSAVHDAQSDEEGEALLAETLAALLLSLGHGEPGENQTELSTLIRRVETVSGKRIL